MSPGIQVELYNLFGYKIPQAAMQIVNDASDERTLDDIRSELRSLAMQIEAADRA
jgi:hypothetical protein